LHEKPPHPLRKIPGWLYILGGTALVAFICGTCVVEGYLASGVLLWTYADRPVACVEGGPGSPAIFSNSGTTLFIFPASASNIQNSCLVFQGASIYVWFEMDASEQDSLIDSMRWDVHPLLAATDPPAFGDPIVGASYLHGKLSEYPEGADIWIDTSSTPNRVYIYAWLD
jgi:hypothetical protein